MAHPRPRLSTCFLVLDNIQLREEQTALRQIERLGFSPGDVRHIVMTHLDFDHAGGIEDFPGVAVHVLGTELDAARERRGRSRAGAIGRCSGTKACTGRLIAPAARSALASPRSVR